MKQMSTLRKRIFSATGLTVLFLFLCLLSFPKPAKTGGPACPFVVDPGGMGTHTTIQAAVDDLPNPGPCTITVKAGTYAEQVSVGDKNLAATLESQRITIVADPTSPPGSVIVDPPGTSNTGFVVNHSKFITVKGFTITGAEKGITLAGGSNSSDNVVLEANEIHDIGSTGASGTAGISIGSGNANTTVVNNLIRNIGRNGITVDSPNTEAIYIVNNTIVQNMWNGVTRAVSANVFLVNNLIANNGSAVGGTGNCRAGLCQTSNGTAATVTLINNFFYNNAGGDLSTPLQQLDATDSGNRTTTGTEAPGVVGCAFADCTNTHALSEIFVNPAVNDYHLKTLPPISPATDKGVNSFVNGGQERVPAVDFEGDLRPKDGNNDTVAITDIGYDEAGPPTSARLGSFTARRYATGRIVVEWRTGYEVDNLGFNIYREQEGKLIRVTPEMIAGSALLAGPGTTLIAGRSYAWSDAPPRGNKDVRYLLEEVDLNGHSVWHGPISINESSPQDRLSTFDRARLLSTLAADARDGQSSTTPLERKAGLPAGGSAEFQLQSNDPVRPLIKLSVKKEGWYRVTQPELIAAGLDPAADPRLLQLFVDGKEQPLKVTGVEDGKFDPSDQVEFYGIGMDSAVTDSRTYWLVTGSQKGQRLQTAPAKGHKSPAASFLYTVERRDRALYFSSLRNGEKENFFGPVVAKKPVDQSLVLQHIDTASTGEAKLEVGLQGVTGVSHRVSVQLNGADVGEITFIGQAQGFASFPVKQASLKEGENEVRLTALGVENDLSLVDYVRLTYWHTYQADNDVLKFRAKSKQRVTIDGFTSAAIRVIDISDPDAVRDVSAAVKPRAGGYAVTVTAPKSGQRTLLAFAENQIKRPAAITADRPSTLRDKQREADLVIITNKELVGSVEPLRTLRQSQGWTVAVVDVEDVYDEFSYGEKTPRALKDFLGYANTNWKAGPRYALIVGDASLDPNNYLGIGDFDLVPTKLIDTQLMETASDDWLVDFDGDGLPEMAIGRLPVRSAQEATAMISRIVSYDKSGGSNSVLLTSDRNEGFDFVAVSEGLRALLPASINAEVIHRGDTDDAAAKSQLLASINRGQRIVNYAGHGSVDLWSGDLLTSGDARDLTNQNLSLFVMMTCLNGYFQDPALDGLAESLMKAEGGGAIAVWASSGLTKPDQQVVLNRKFLSLIFDNGSSAQSLTLGDATVKAKAAVSDIDVRRTWLLFGDPMTRLR